MEDVLALVENDDLRNEVSALKTSAFNKVQLVKGEAKQELLDRLDKAHDKLIAATAVKGLQNATQNLTEDNLDNANIKLSNAKTNVRKLEDGEIKDALMKLIETEEYKIVKFQQDKIDVAVKAAQDSINALPAPDKITKENLEEVKNQIAKVKILLEEAKALDPNVGFNLYPLEQAEAAVANFVTVILDLDGGTVKDGAVTEFEVKKGEKLELPHPITLKLKK